MSQTSSSITLYGSSAWSGHRRNCYQQFIKMVKSRIVIRLCSEDSKWLLVRCSRRFLARRHSLYYGEYQKASKWLNDCQLEAAVNFYWQFWVKPHHMFEFRNKLFISIHGDPNQKWWHHFEFVWSKRLPADYAIIYLSFRIYACLIFSATK